MIWLFLLAMAHVHGGITTNITDCSLIQEIPESLQCQFAKTYCQPSILFNYYQLRFCSFNSANSFVYFVVLFLILYLIFYVLYSASDKYLSSSLSRLAKYCQLSPAVAGLTFLSFGNGAPDFFTSFSAVSEKPLIMMGSSVGSGIFIVSLVLGWIILFSPMSEADQVEYQKISGHWRRFKYRLLTETAPISSFSFIKNFIIYSISIVILFGLAISKSIHLWVPILFLVMYLGHLATALIIHVKSRSSNPNNIMKISNEALNGVKSLISPLEILKDAKLDDSAFNIEMNNRESSEDLKHKVMRNENNESTDEFIPNSPPKEASFSYLSLIRKYFQLELDEFRKKNLYQKVFGVVMFPFDVLLWLTIPPLWLPADEIESNNLDQVLKPLYLMNRIRCIINPWFTIAFIMYTTRTFNHVVFAPSIYSYHIYLIVAASLTLLVFLTTKNFHAPIYEPAIVVLAFSVCIFWIYILSNEVLDILSTIGHLLKINDGILGITILAWGNSFGDLVADVAVANAGDFETALTAVFCGPIQNVLLTLSISFLKVLVFEHSNIVFEDNLTDIFIAYSFLILVMCVCFISVVFIFNYRMKRYLGLIFVISYTVYFFLAIVISIALEA